jgi:signal transduction histidine kinase
MKIKDLNIRERLTVQFLGLVGLLFLVFSISIYYFGKLYIENRFYKRLQDKTLHASTLYFDFNGGQKAMFTDILKGVDKKELESLQDEFVSIYDVSRKLFVISSDLYKENLHVEFIKGLDLYRNVHEKSVDGMQFVGLTIHDKSGDYIVTVSAKDKAGKSAMSDLKNILTVLSLVALLFIAVQAWYFANKALSPITSVAMQLREIFPKNLSKRIFHPNPHDEIGQLAFTLNAMLQRAQENASTQKLFIANISHELKNPLTKIFTQIELLDLKYQNQPELNSQIVSLKEDAHRLIHLNEVILGLANTYSSDADLPMKKSRIDEILLNAISEFKKWNTEAQVNFEIVDIPDDEQDFLINANEDALQVVFKNLMDNASKFSDDNSMQVILENKKKQLAVCIINKGQDIPVTEQEKIFEPFFRSNATALGKKGHGVGLAVVKQIMGIHKGKIAVRSFNFENSFTLTFPKYV